jgi:hypothetical protein
VLRRASVTTVAVVALALAGSAAAGSPASRHISIPLPAPLKGKIVELISKGTPPPGTSNYSIGGSPFQLMIGNLGALPSYIRATATVVQVKPLEFDIFIFINAPKGLVHTTRQTAATRSGANAIDLIIASAAEAFPADGVTVTRGDGCKEFVITVKREGGNSIHYLYLGPWQSPGKSIADFTKAADPNCK